jgi:flagellar basal body-associated protein FliL
MNMQKNSRKQSGMAALTGMLVVVLVAAIAGVAWYVYSNNEAAKLDDGSASQTIVEKNEDAPEIKSTTDIDEASKDLDDQEIDKTLDTTTLDSDINSLF